MFSTRDYKGPTGELGNIFRIEELDGFKFICHAWVLAFHILRIPGIFNALARNGDSSIFFILSGLNSELTFQKFEARNNLTLPSDHVNINPHSLPTLRNPKLFYSWYLNYVRNRVAPFAIFCLIIFAISYLIFPFYGAEGSDMLWNVFTLTVGFLDYPSNERSMWNPNSIVWFVSAIVLMWLLHPIVRPLALKFQTDFSPFYRSVILVSVWSWGLCMFLFPYSLKSSGFCFMPWPRFVQYAGGVFIGQYFGTHLSRRSFYTAAELANPVRDILAEGIDKSQSGSKIEKISSFQQFQILLSRFCPDLLFSFFLLVCLHGYRHARYSSEWRLYWVWKTLGMTPVYTVEIYYLLMQSCVTHFRSSGRNINNNNNRLGLKREEDRSSTTENRKMISAILNNKWDLFRNRITLTTPLANLCGCRFIHRIAPGITNMVAFLLHFPIAFQLYFDKNTLYLGTGVIHYMITLWIVSFLISRYIFPKFSNLFVNNRVRVHNT